MSELMSYSILLAVGICGDILFLANGSGVVTQPYSIWVNIKAALIFSFTHIVMALFAINIGFIIADLIPNFSQAVGLLLIAIVGIKSILETSRIMNDQRTFLIEDFQILIGVSLASSFNTVLAYMGYGLYLVQFSLSSIPVLAAFVFFTVLIGVFIGNKFHAENLGKFSKYFGGVIFIILAVFLAFH